MICYLIFSVLIAAAAFTVRRRSLLRLTGAAFYARFGFEPSHTVVGFFIDNYPEPIYENGERCTDMLYFKKELR